jgi:hypothetical protein
MGAGGTYDRASVMTYDEYLSLVDDSHPMTTSRGHIADICEACAGSAGTILELGSHAGISAAAIAMAAPQATVIAVDLCDTVPELNRVSYWFGLRLKNITPVPADAGQYLRDAVANGLTYDVIFHDAQHGESVVGEYVLAASLCATLIIHDWEQLSPASQAEVAQCFGKWTSTPDRQGRELFIGRKEFP